MKLYGLFKPITLPTGKRRYKRIAGTDAYLKPVAVRVFQDRLMWEGLTLRPIKDAPPSQPAEHETTGQCKPCYEHLHTGCERGACDCACRRFNA